MFLMMLNDDQKKLFLKLAVKAAEVNGVVEYEEKNMLKAFALEVKETPIYSADSSTSEILDDLKRISSPKEKRIITFEILGILFSDNEYDEEEKKFVSEIAESFDISRNQIDQMVKLINDYSDLYNKIVNTVLIE